ncbi:MAG: GNAT family N-acetyltransferase [Pseudomonadota bacterium]
MRNLIATLLIVLLVPVLNSTSVAHAQDAPWIPGDFTVPTQLENEHFRLRTLTVNDVIKDYDAVMSSRDHLKSVFGPNSDWPQADLSLEQDLIDLGWHQKEFQIRSSFAYTVVSLDEQRVLGCVYIFPARRGGYDAEITLWVRADVVKDGYDAILYKTVTDWIAADWPFEKPAYPGRSISWEDWEALN